MLQRGEVVDRYEIESVLGHGGMAVVYCVRHTELGGTYALKVLTGARTDLQQRLLAEGRIQSALQHPNLVRVHDVLRVGGSPALVMDLVGGTSLDRWLPRPLDEALRVFRQIVHGVAHAHAHGLVHRDLKPANVLVDDRDVPKVADFGIAKVLAETDGHTRTGSALGTPRYMPPEQIRDAGSVDARADVYALGCLLYEMVCGRSPFDGNDLIAIHAAAVNRTWTPPRDLVPELPRGVAEAIEGALAADRERRIPDCGTLLAVLDGAGWTARADRTWDEDPVGERYELGELLSDGPHGRTWQATRTADGASVVVRAPPEGADEKAVELFRREATVLRQLDHPAFPRMIDDLGARFVREHVPGPTLAEWIASRRASVDEITDVLARLLEILVYLHGLAPPVVLRDVTPERIVRDATGALRVPDLSAVRDTPADPDLGGSTFHGTFGYMAPEQFAGDAAPATDVYGAAAVTVHLLTRKHPKTLQDASGRLAWEKHASAPAELTALLRRMLDLDPRKRPTAAEALRQLRPAPAPVHEPRRSAVLDVEPVAVGLKTAAPAPDDPLFQPPAAPGVRGLPARRQGATGAAAVAVALSSVLLAVLAFGALIFGGALFVTRPMPAPPPVPAPPPIAAPQPATPPPVAVPVPAPPLSPEADEGRRLLQRLVDAPETQACLDAFLVENPQWGEHQGETVIDTRSGRPVVTFDDPALAATELDECLVGAAEGLPDLPSGRVKWKGPLDRILRPASW